MPKVNVYLPDDLADQVRAARLPVSRICQLALSSVLLRRADHGHAATGADPLPEDPGLTPPANYHVRAILREAYRQAADRGAGAVGTGELLAGFLEEGESLILRTLELLGFPRATIRDALDLDPVVTPASGDPLLSPGARAALERAAREAASHGADVVTGSHLLLGLLEDDGAAGAALRASGVAGTVTPAVLAAFYYGVTFGRFALDDEPARPAPDHALTEQILVRLDAIERRVRALPDPG